MVVGSKGHFHMTSEKSCKMWMLCKLPRRENLYFRLSRTRNLIGKMRSEQQQDPSQDFPPSVCPQ